MVRRRKIPVRKHHGVRDPLKQLEIKEKKLQNLVNSPPQKDDQKLSYKFVQFKKLADQAKAGKKIKRIHSGVEDMPKELATSNRPGILSTDSNKFKKIKQVPGEEDLEYIKRVNRITTASLKEAQYEAKYGVKVIRDSKTGEILIKKKPPNEIDELLKQKQKEMRSTKQKKKKNGVEKNVKPLNPNLIKQLVKQAIQEDEEEKLQEKEKEIVEYRRDVVKFGEIVHAPPTILTLPKKAQKSETVPRPGGRNNLLLKDLLNPKSTKDTSSIDTKTTNQKSKSNKASTIFTKNQLKGKRRDLPAATRNMLENERQKFVSLYRNLKKSKGVQPDKLI